ncbi:MAG: hypothetical protein ACI9YT_002687 [Halobacteriales archaeon]|jgi:hypothetical protein
MELDQSETLELFGSECSFPADPTDVIEAVGDARIEAPNGDSVAIEAIIERSNEATYSSAVGLHSTVMCLLDEDHVGRKAYDDRSNNVARDEELSF